jgi:Apea-like HEPN
MHWTAIALLNPHWHAVAVDGRPRAVTSNVHYEPVPAWLESVASDDLARDELGEHAKSIGDYCLSTQYTVDAMAPHQPGSSPSNEVSPHDEARRKLQTASLVLWISRRTSFGFDKIVIAHEAEDGWKWRELTSHDVRIALPSYESVDVLPEDFAVAHRYSQIFENAKDRGTVRTASHALGMALSQSDWALRYLSLWLTLECLFGPEDARETTFRLCQRISLFLEPRGPGAVDLFKKVNESYRWRSKIVHGMRLKKLEPDESLELLERLETLVHRALQRVLSEQSILDTFDSAKREPYLDHLALT